MATLGNPQNTIAILQKYGIHLQKKFGQNFLVDSKVLKQIVESAGVGPDDFVIEIGPGIGTLTQYLCESAGEVAAVEVDAHLIPILKETLAPYPNVEVIHGDILKVDVQELIRYHLSGEFQEYKQKATAMEMPTMQETADMEKSTTQEAAQEVSAMDAIQIPVEEKQDTQRTLQTVKVVANLPYYITTPILLSLLEGHLPVDSITVMVQAEVAQRMQSGPGTKDYGALSLAVQYYARPEVVLEVPHTCFIPQPKVDSSVIRLDLYNSPPVEVGNEKQMFKIIRAAFNQRRKTLVNALANAGLFPLDKSQLADCLRGMGLPETVRGEVLTLTQFAQLSDVIDDYRNS